MNAFIFQSRPDRYDLNEAIKPGEQDTWYATRYRSQMQPGDVVLFWMAGSERGIYGWGRLTSNPYIKADWSAHGVDVQYEHKFAQPLSWRIIARDPALEDLLILRAPQATNFLLEQPEAEALRRLIESKGEQAPSELGMPS